MQVPLWRPLAALEHERSSGARAAAGQEGRASLRPPRSTDGFPPIKVVHYSIRGPLDSLPFVRVESHPQRREAIIMFFYNDQTAAAASGELDGAGDFTNLNDFPAGHFGKWTHIAG
jgi:hypothetical protein